MNDLERRGWFADVDDPEDPDAGCSEEFPWQAVIQVAGACHPIGGVWFSSKADCEEFIRDEIIGKGWIPPLGGARQGNPSEIKP